MEETVKPIPGFEGYFISSLGKVYCNLGRGSRRNGRIVETYEVKGRPTKNYYPRVYMRSIVDGKRYDRYVHRLVGEAFVPKPSPECRHVNHRNRRRQDNRMENIEWVTQRQNNEYAVKVGHRIKDAVTGRFVSSGFDIKGNLK